MEFRVAIDSLKSLCVTLLRRVERAEQVALDPVNPGVDANDLPGAIDLLIGMLISSMAMSFVDRLG